MRNYRNYTDQNIIEYSLEVKSLAGLLKKLNLKPSGGNYRQMKKNLCRLNIDTKHWTGQAWNKNQQLKDWKDYSSKNIKKHLIKVKTHKCEKCKLKNWNGKQIPLEIHHIDNNNRNNEFKNLQLLCCNCHAQTEGWRRPSFLKNLLT